MSILTLPVVLLAVAFGILQIWLGFVGLGYLAGDWGTWVSWGSIALLVFTRIMLPLTIGTYFGVVEVYGYPWWAGVLVAAPGIVFMVPAYIGVLVQTIKEQFRG